MSNFFGNSSTIHDGNDASNNNRAALVSPDKPTYFKKKVCYRYVNNPETGTCKGCQKSSSDGFHHPGHENAQSKWTSDMCAIQLETDCFGVIEFPASKTKQANFIRVSDLTKPADMIQYLYSKEGFNLSPPKLILSVTGGAQNFTIPLRMKKAFKEGLVKAAATTGAWIISGGTNTGVMRLVGEAVAEEYAKYSTDREEDRLVVLGIATWGNISMKDQLVTESKRSSDILSFGVNKVFDSVREKNQRFYYAKKETESTEGQVLRAAPKKSKDVLLDPNHNNFILVDDGSIGAFGKEIEFRAHLEAELRKGKTHEYYKQQFKDRCRRLRQSQSVTRSHHSNRTADEVTHENVPMVLIVVQGGPGTLRTVSESLEMNIPVLVLADSKGCADLIANACSQLKTDPRSLWNLIEESKMFEKLRGKEEFGEKIGMAVNQLQKIIQKKKDNLVNVFKLDSDESCQTIELAILRAHLNSRKKEYYENLKLALQWNRVDIAKTDIFTGEEEFTDKQKTHLLEMALTYNMPDFVELMLESGVDLKSFLTKRRLYFLYNSSIIQDSERKCPLLQLFKQKYQMKNLITFKGLHKFLTDYLFKDFKAEFLPKDEDVYGLKNFIEESNRRESTDAFSDPSQGQPDSDHQFGTDKVDFPEKNLFVWALFLRRFDLAKIFWKMGEFQIITALFASNLLKKMSARLSDLEDELQSVASYYEDTACGVLNLFDENSDDLLNSVILLARPPFYKELDCLEMAIQGKCLKFVALSSVQTLITNIWNAEISAMEGFQANFKFFLSILSLGLLAPFLVFEKRHNLIELIDSEDKKQELEIAKHHLYKNDKLKSINSYKLSKDHEMFNCCRSSPEDDDEDVGDNDSIHSNVDRDTVEALMQIEAGENKDGLIQVLNMKQFVPEITVPEQALIEEEKEKNFFQIYWSRLKGFLHAPKVHFVYEESFFIFFLMLFSYVLLCEFNYYGYEPEESKNTTAPAESSTESLLNLTVADTDTDTGEPDAMVKRIIGPSIPEFVLMFWVFSFIFDEMYQFMRSDGDKENSSFRTKAMKYLGMGWNYIDIIGCILFTIAMALRLIALKTSESVFIAARIILAIDLAVFFLRVLHVLINFQSLGPKLIMIQRMIKDLIFFMVILGIFVCLFGITTQSTLYPDNELNYELFTSIMNKAFWPIFGEMKILEEISELDECTIEGNCPLQSGITFSYIFLMVYMVLANILLINLLIAMFSNTFEKVQENTDQLWKFQRYRLVFEYVNSSIFPPPISFIGYIYELLNYLIKKKENKVQPKSEDFVQEKKYAEMYIVNERNEKNESVDSRLKTNSLKLDTLEQKLNEVLDSKAQLELAQIEQMEQQTEAINWLLRQFDRHDNPAPFIMPKSCKRRTNF